MTAKVPSKGWVVIPSELREKYRLDRGTEVQFVDYGGVLSIVPRKSAREAKGMLRGGRSLTKALLAARSEEKAREW